MIIAHERSPAFRKITSDQVNVAAINDTFGTRFSLDFSRIDAISVSEEVMDLPGGGFQIIANQSPTSKIIRTVEVSVEMRPETILLFLGTLRKSLAGLPPDRIEKLKSYSELYEASGLTL